MPSRKKAKAATKPTRVCVPWFRFVVGGCTWSVVLVDPVSICEAAGDRVVDGLAIPDKSLIFIDCELSEDRIGVALMHEILHSTFSFPGCGAAMEHRFGCSGEKLAKREEIIVSNLAPELAGALLSCGALKFPKLRGFHDDETAVG